MSKSAAGDVRTTPVIFFSAGKFIALLTRRAFSQADKSVAEDDGRIKQLQTPKCELWRCDPRRTRWVTNFRTGLQIGSIHLDRTANDLASMLRNPASEIEPELNSGEQLLWSGRPKQGIRLRPADAFMIPFSLLWCGFAIFWEGNVVGTGAPLFFKLWGLPFVLIGLYIVFGRFFVDARIRQRTFYGITNERIIIITGLRSRQTKSLQLRTLSDISLTERSDGGGTITFGPQHPMARNIPSGWPGAGAYGVPSLDLIDRAKEVYGIIRQAQRAAN